MFFERLPNPKTGSEDAPAGLSGKLEGLFGGIADFFGRKRFGQVVDRAHSRSFNGGFDTGISGNDNDHGFGSIVPNYLQKFQTFNFGNLQVKQYQRICLFFDFFKGLGFGHRLIHMKIFL